MRNIQRSTLLLICLTFFGIQAVYSCSCIKRTLEGQIAATGFVFVGKVVEIKEDTSKKRQLYESQKYIVKLKVIENFKGA